MDEVSVPAEQMLDVQGLKGPFSCLKWGYPRALRPRHCPLTRSLRSNARFGISFGAVGALEEAIRVTREYALERYVDSPSRLRCTLLSR